MSYDDNRDVMTFYGICPTYWTESFGGISNTHNLLTQEYINEWCSVTTCSTASGTIFKFLYPFWIKKDYFVEGTARGQITYIASGGASVLTSYRVTISKMNVNTTETELFSTGWITVSISLSTGSDCVLPFWIKCTPEKALTSNDRILVKVETVTTNTYLKLCFDNSSTWEDLKIDIPFRL